MSQFDVMDVARTGESVLAVNKVLKNTYMLLGMTLAFSALMAFVSTNAVPMNIWMYIIGVYGLLFATHALAKSAWGLLTMFAFAGFIGYGTGPLIGALMSTSAGSQVVTTALGSFLNGFITAGMFVLLAAVILGIFVKIPALQLAISVGFMLFSSAIILHQTGQIVNGGERNYILATITLFVSIYNLFMSLIHLLTAFSGDE